MNLASSLLRLRSFSEAEERYRLAVRVYGEVQSSLGDMHRSKVAIFEEQSIAYGGLEKTLLLQEKISEALQATDSRRSRVLIDRMATRIPGEIEELRAPLSVNEMLQLAAATGSTFLVYSLVSASEEEGHLGVYIVSPSGLEYVPLEFGEALKQIPHPESTSSVAGSPGREKSRESELFGALFEEIEQANTLGEAAAAGASSEMEVSSETDSTATREGLAALMKRAEDRPKDTGQKLTDNLTLWYEKLIAPIEDHLPRGIDSKVTFVLDGGLMEIPFALLLDLEGNYLFEKFTISMTPSLKVAALLERRKKAMIPQDAPLIVGNPISPEVSRLPYSEIEAISIQKALGADSEQTLTGEAATKTKIVERMKTANYIHLGCHGSPLPLDNNSLYRGAFYLTPDEGNSGVLYAEEIAQMELSPELVVLSACHSGRGKIQRDGVLGPIRSFLAGGAPRVLATYWTLPDSQLTVDMVTAYYNYVTGANPLPYDEALREVLKIGAATARGEPHKWGAFFLAGDPGSISSVSILE